MREHTAQPTLLRRRDRYRDGGVVQRRQTTRGAVLNDELEATGRAEATHRRWGDDEDVRLGDSSHPLSSEAHDGLRVDAASPTFRKRCHREEQGGRITGIGRRGAVEPAEARDVLDARDPAKVRDGAPHHCVGARQRRARW